MYGLRGDYEVGGSIDFKRQVCNSLFCLFCRASTPIPRNSLCRKRGGIRCENYFYFIQRSTIKSVCPLKGDVVIIHWIQRV